MWNIYISTISNITADTVVISFTLALVERRNPSNSNDIHDVINYSKKEFRFERGICHYIPAMVQKLEKTQNWETNTPFINQSEDSILI